MEVFFFFLSRAKLLAVDWASDWGPTHLTRQKPLYLSQSMADSPIFCDVDRNKCLRSVVRVLLKINGN